MRMNWHHLMNEATDGSAGGGSSGGGAAPDPGGAPAAAAGLLSLAAPSPAPQAAAAPAAAPVAVNIPDNWKDALPQELKDLPTLKAIHNIADLVKTMDHGQRMIGRNNVSIPDWRAATPDDKKAFFQKIGLPQRLEEYQVEVPKGAKFADGFLSSLKETAFKTGMLPHQTNEFLAWYHQANEQALSDFTAQEKKYRDDREQKLKTEWGNDFQRNTMLSNGMLRKAFEGSGLAEDEVNSWLRDGSGSDPILLKLLLNMSKLVREDVIADQGGELPASAASIQEEINSVMGDTKHAFHDKHHPNHRNAVQQMEKLFQKLHPPKPQIQNAM